MRAKFELADVVGLFGARFGCQNKAYPAAKQGTGQNSQLPHCLPWRARRSCAKTVVWFVTVTIAVATGIAPNVRLQNRHSGLTTWCKAPCPVKALPHCIHGATPVEWRLPAQPKNVLRPALCCGLEYTPVIRILAFWHWNRGGCRAAHVGTEPDRLHPHIHCIVPAAGYTLDGRWKNIGHSGKYLYPVHQLSSAFKGKFLDSLKRALRKQNELSLFNDKVQQAYKTKWVVHCEPSLAGAEHVVKYLGQYTHRVAITNQRILNIADGKVTFIAKDYRDRAIKKPVTLDGVEFLRRFTMHILPRRFVKIRRFGIYNHTVKRNLNLQFVRGRKTRNWCSNKTATTTRNKCASGLNGSLVLTHVNARCAKPDGWLPSGNCLGYVHRHGSLRNKQRHN